ncbi:MAG: YkgJ family cysteine cluster protein, partial [Myxococcales bacterium]|nr:YkgJ family cysteine cluster protein [Myxococcales bacterium]
CCREGFDLVQIGRREPLTRLRPDLITDDGFGLGLTRPGGRCVALDPDAPPWHCTVYAHRPRACREFAIGGDACLEARRRTGLSR